jgi:pyridoxine 5-phosphate synthase
VDYVELHTGRYANAQRASEESAAVDAIHQSAKFAVKLNIGVNAGHGLTYRNARRLAGIKEIVEFNIGHSIVVRAVQVGLERAVMEMKELVK